MIPHPGLSRSWPPRIRKSVGWNSAGLTRSESLGKEQLLIRSTDHAGHHLRPLGDRLLAVLLQHPETAESP